MRMIRALVKRSHRLFSTVPVECKTVVNQREVCGKNGSDDVNSVPINSSFQQRSPSERVVNLAGQICSLSLLEVASLVDVLQTRLNINHTTGAFPFGVNLSAAQSMMSGLGGSDASFPSAINPPEKVVEKSQFKLTLEKYDPTAKAKVIREIKAIIPKLTLVEAKNLVEGAPSLIRDDVKKEEAEKIKKTLEEIGATVKME